MKVILEDGAVEIKLECHELEEAILQYAAKESVAKKLDLTYDDLTQAMIEIETESGIVINSKLCIARLHLSY